MGVCGFTLPQRDFADAIRVWRFAIAVGAIAAGLAGATLVFLLMLVHLGDLRSLGVEYLWPMSSGEMPPLRRRLIQDKHRKAVLRPENIRNQR